MFIIVTHSTEWPLNKSQAYILPPNNIIINWRWIFLNIIVPRCYWETPFLITTIIYVLSSHWFQLYLPPSWGWISWINNIKNKESFTKMSPFQNQEVSFYLQCKKCFRLVWIWLSKTVTSQDTYSDGTQQDMNYT